MDSVYKSEGWILSVHVTVILFLMWQRDLSINVVSRFFYYYYYWTSKLSGKYEISERYPLLWSTGYNVRAQLSTLRITNDSYFLDYLYSLLVLTTSVWQQFNFQTSVPNCVVILTSFLSKLIYKFFPIFFRGGPGWSQ